MFLNQLIGEFLTSQGITYYTATVDGSSKLIHEPYQPTMDAIVTWLTNSKPTFDIAALAGSMYLSINRKAMFVTRTGQYSALDYNRVLGSDIFSRSWLRDEAPFVVEQQPSLDLFFDAYIAGANAAMMELLRERKGVYIKTLADDTQSLLPGYTRVAFMEKSGFESYTIRYELWKLDFNGASYIATGSVPLSNRNNAYTEQTSKMYYTAFQNSSWKADPTVYVVDYTAVTGQWSTSIAEPIQPGYIPGVEAMLTAYNVSGGDLFETTNTSDGTVTSQTVPVSLPEGGSLTGISLEFSSKEISDAITNVASDEYLARYNFGITDESKRTELLQIASDFQGADFLCRVVLFDQKFKTKKLREWHTEWSELDNEFVLGGAHNLTVKMFDNKYALREYGYLSYLYQRVTNRTIVKGTHDSATNTWTFPDTDENLLKQYNDGEIELFVENLSGFKVHYDNSEMIAAVRASMEPNGEAAKYRNIGVPTDPNADSFAEAFLASRLAEERELINFILYVANIIARAPTIDHQG